MCNAFYPVQLFRWGTGTVPVTYEQQTREDEPLGDSIYTQLTTDQKIDSSSCQSLRPAAVGKKALQDISSRNRGLALLKEQAEQPG